MGKKGFDFKKYYSELKEFFPSIVTVSEDNIEKIQDQIDKENTQYQTKRYIESVFAASLTIILFPFLITKIHQSFGVVPELIQSLSDIVEESNKDIYNFSLGFGAIAILMYLFILPSFKALAKIQRTSNLFQVIDKKHRSFIIAIIVGVYVAFGLLSFIILINFQSISDITLTVIKYYLFIPIALLSFILLMILVVIFLAPWFRKRSIRQYSNNTRIEISILLLKTLKKLQKRNNGEYLPQSLITSILSDLEDIRILIRTYPSTISNSINNQELIGDFKKASGKFEMLISEIIENQETNLKSFKDGIVKYLNIFLNGDLNNLPKATDVMEYKKTKKVKFYHYLLLGIYLTLPILAVFSLKIVFNISLDDYTQSLLKILYIIWAFIGVFSNPFIFNTENKELMKDLIKTLIGKG